MSWNYENWLENNFNPKMDYYFGIEPKPKKTKKSKEEE
tara:strand:+ start:101 stop:214 length:114 start_codon:yes stop_codon:yes gene_type:complete